MAGTGTSRAPSWRDAVSPPQRLGVQGQGSGEQRWDGAESQGTPGLLTWRKNEGTWGHGHSASPLCGGKVAAEGAGGPVPSSLCRDPHLAEGTKGWRGADRVGLQPYF